MTLSVVLPLPSRALNPHAKGHWRPKHKATAEARQIAKLLCQSAMQESGITGFSSATYSITFYQDRVRAKIQKGYCPQDDGNAVQAVKAYVDGCVDAGLITDDKSKVLKLGGVRIFPSKESEGMACVVLSFEGVAV